MNDQVYDLTMSTIGINQRKKPGHMGLMFLYFVLLLLGITTINATAPGNQTDQFALLAFKATIEKDPHGILDSWNLSVNFCNWVGITCGMRHPQRVVALNLSTYSLVGTLSPHLANLTFLKTMDLSSNNFYSDIPHELGQLWRLQELKLRNNSLQGEIPANLSHCKELKIVWLSRNKLGGSIPQELGSLPRLTILILGMNNLVGVIPPSFGNLSFLGELSLAYNQLEGIIPDNMSRLKKLWRLTIGNNRLSGMFPPTFYNLSALMILAMELNDLEGQLPADIGLTLPNLQELTAGENLFSGPMPVSFANASRLEIIDFFGDQLTGPIPLNLGTLKRLRILDLSGNQLTNTKGSHELSLITPLANCTLLKVLNVENNNLDGAIPATIANFSSQMKILLFGGNQISGSIPTEMGNLIGLNSLSFDHNFLTGSIPVSIGKLSNLQGLYLSQNRLFGNIPSSLGNITMLTKLYLDENMLKGGIPFSLGNCEQLEEVFFAENKLNGTIPIQIMSSQSIIQFFMSNNFFTGSLLLEIGRMKSLQILDISENRLTGEIPGTLANCLDLRKLSIAGNMIQGSIPPTLSTLKNVEKMDLSRNNLSGQIPNYLEKYSFLIYLNLSFNDFDGEVPKQGVFRNISAISIIGNDKLCGGVPELHLKSCPKNASKKLQPKLLILLATVIALSALFSCILGFLCWQKKLRKVLVSTSTKKESHLHVSYAQLFKATNGFSLDNLIGTGSCGSVYKGSLQHAVEVLAIKVLNLQLQGASKSFIAECEVLRNIRHRNLVKLLTVCSSIDFQGNDFKALVLQYMPRGSLEKWLHHTEDEEHQQINLNFLQRLNIAMDVASALDYLHHQYDVPVVHCDLKPSNVLLDDDMVAHVSDFGLAKLLNEAASNYSYTQSSSVGVKGTIGYVAPEYGTSTIASTQGDVYSYGVLLLEMFTARRPTDNVFKDGFNLHEFAKMAWPNRVLEIVDLRLLLEVKSTGHESDQDYRMQQCLASVVKVGITCSAYSPSERMDMASVVREMVAIKKLYIQSSSMKKESMASSLEGPSYLSTY